MTHLFDFEYSAQFNRLLKDSEIIDAIKKRLIVLDDPEVYIQDRRDDLIQPASMDLVLRNGESVNKVDGVVSTKLDYIYPVPHHPDLDDSFVTFWPGYQTEVSVNYLIGYNGNILMPRTELRSTLRRIGLDIGSMQGIGLGYDDFGFLWIRNAQAYPVSVKKGQKIAQVLWKDLGYDRTEYGCVIEERKVKYGSGKKLTSCSDLVDLIGQGDLFLSSRHLIYRGFVLFHANKVRTYCNQEHVIIDDNGVHGFDVRTEEATDHTINPGEFSDIKTLERIRLSSRVAMQVFYRAKPMGRIFNQSELVNSLNTSCSTGGWIDPGYGYDKKGGATFSVQRKAFTEPVKIREGELVGYGVIWFFPEPVEKPYSQERGSHYV